MRMHQRRPHIVFLASALLSYTTFAICAADSEGTGERPRVFVNLGCNPYTYWDAGFRQRVTSNCTGVDDLDQIVRKFADTHHLRFEFGATKARLFVLRSTNYLACLWYAPAKEHPALLCMFDFDRRVVSHRIGIATLSSGELPAIVFGVEAVRVESGVLGATTNLLSPESISSLVKELISNQDANIDFSRQQTGIAVAPDHRFLDVFTDFGNYRSDIRCHFDFDRHVTVTWVSPGMREKGLEVTTDGKLKRMKEQQR